VNVNTHKKRARPKLSLLAVLEKWAQARDPADLFFFSGNHTSLLFISSSIHQHVGKAEQDSDPEIQERAKQIRLQFKAKEPYVRIWQ
jgi:hypothetical protein